MVFSICCECVEHCYIRMQPETWLWNGAIKKEMFAGTVPSPACLNVQHSVPKDHAAAQTGSSTISETAQRTQIKRLPSHMDKAETANCQVEKITFTESLTHPHKAHSKSVTPTMQYKPMSKDKTVHINPTRALQPTHRIACNNFSTDSRTVI